MPLVPNKKIPKPILRFFVQYVLLVIFAALLTTSPAFPDDNIIPSNAHTVPSFLSDSLVKSGDSTQTDTLSKTKTDTIALSKDALEDPVKYKAKDSLRFEVDSEKVYLWGEAEVIFGATSLKAGYILMDMKNDLVYAYGIPDSSGKMTQYPEFTDGAQNFKSKRMMYNIKTKI